MIVFNKKKAQTLIEFVLIAALVGVVGGTSYLAMNPQLFRDYFKTSTNSTSKSIDANGQLEICSFDDPACTTPAPVPPSPTIYCLPKIIGATESDGTKYAGNVGGHDICTTVADQSGSPLWGHVGTNTGITSTTDGQANTAALVALGANYQAANSCADLNLNGHTDWYLPAYNELTQLYDNRVAIDNFKTSISLAHYWSSTENDHEKAKLRNFNNGDTTFHKKNNPAAEGTFYTRCVRHD